MFRKMKNGEEEKVAEVLTEAFIEYPLYRECLRGCTDYRHQLTKFMFVWVNIWQDSTYVNEEMNFVACLEKPEDNNPSPFSRRMRRLLVDQFRDYSLASRLRMLQYLLISERVVKKYNQKGDYYLHSLATIGTARGSGIIFRFFNEVVGSRPFLCETHTERNKRLYERMGMVLCEALTWHHLPHYLLRRPEDADCNYESAIAEHSRKDPSPQ